MSATRGTAFDHVPVLVVADPQDELPGIVDALKDGVKAVDVVTDDDRAVGLVSSGRPMILVLAFSRLEQAQAFYLRALKRSSPNRMDALQAIALCNRTEAQAGFNLCREEILDDYLVARPLYDPHQLALCVKQARDRLALKRWFTEMTDRSERAGINERLEDLDDTIRAYAPGNPRLLNALAELRRAVEELSAQLDHGVEMMEGPRMARARAAHLPSPAPRAVPPAPRGLPRRGATVLAVDDDEFHLRIVREVLESDGYHVLAALDGAEALALLGGQRVDLVLMDIELPKLSGIEVTRRLRKLQPNCAPPVIMLSGHSHRDLVLAALEAGALDFIVKPGTRAGLLERVAMTLRATQESRERRVILDGAIES